MKSFIWTVLLVLAVGTVAAAAEETAENPRYKMWAAFKPGTTSKSETTSVSIVDGQEIKQKLTLTATLKEVTPEKAVVEMSGEMEMNGHKTSLPTHKIDIQAKVPTSAASQPLSAPAGTTMTKKGEGDEEIAVGAKKYKTHWTEYDMKGQIEGTTKIWISKEVPGGMVKSEDDWRKPMKMKRSTEVVEFKPAS